MLPFGIHQVLIEGRRAKEGATGIVLDDVLIQDCAKFGENCFKQENCGHEAQNSV